MGGDPRTSVVDEDLRVRGTSNLYVAGGAPFVTCGVAHPTLTISAFPAPEEEHLLFQENAARRLSNGNVLIAKAGTSPGKERKRLFQGRRMQELSEVVSGLYGGTSRDQGPQACRESGQDGGTTVEH